VPHGLRVVGSRSLVLLIAAGISIAVGYGGSKRLSGGVIGGGKHDPARSSLPSGDRVLVVLISASWCAGGQTSSLPERLRLATTQLGAVLADSGVGMSTLAVALDTDTKVGWKYLGRFSWADEVSIGGGWANGTVRRYIWDVGVEQRDTAVPQVLLVRQGWVGDSTRLAVTDEVIVERVVGAQAVERWADSVARTPRLDSRDSRGPRRGAGTG
jgi:hypothetical protein